MARLPVTKRAALLLVQVFESASRGGGLKHSYHIIYYGADKGVITLFDVEGTFIKVRFQKREG